MAHNVVVRMREGEGVGWSGRDLNELERRGVPGFCPLASYEKEERLWPDYFFL